MNRKVGYPGAIHFATPGDFQETSFLQHFVFRGYELVELLNDNGTETRPLVCVLSSADPHIQTRMTQLYEDVRPDVWLFVSDESLQLEFPDVIRAGKIFRHYFNPVWARRGALTIPLGPSNRFLDAFLEVGPVEVEERNVVWAFAGEEKGSRAAMVELFAGRIPGKVHFTKSFMGDDSISGNEMLDLYRSSHFVLCPPGNKSPETFRIYEALFSGAIPLLGGTALGSGYRAILGSENPLPVFSNWKQAADFAEELYGDPERLKDMHSIVDTWFDWYLTSLHSDISITLCSNRYSRRKGLTANFSEQSSMGWNYRVNLAFHRHYPTLDASRLGRWLRVVDQLYKKTKASRVTKTVSG